MSIIIFSRPIQTGKTTELMQWFHQQQAVEGVLMPVLEGKRKMMDIASKQLFELECDDPENESRPVVRVGRYCFYEDVFNRFNEALLKKCSLQPRWLVIDEIGKLELEGKGFYPAVRKILDAYYLQHTATQLLFVVRESLCDAVTEYFNIKEFTMIYTLETL